MKYPNLPTLLTIIRLIASPLILPILFVYLLPLNVFWVNISLAVFFVLLSLTDFFDGYLARKMKQESLLGKMLDPLADKFLIYSALVALVAANKIFFYWAILLIGREFFVMGLRLVAYEHGFSIHVSYISKIKTALLMTCLTVIVANPYQSLSLSAAFKWNGIEALLLLATIGVSLFSAKLYHDEFIHKFKYEQRKLPEMR